MCDNHFDSVSESLHYFSLTWRENNVTVNETLLYKLDMLLVVNNVKNATTSLYNLRRWLSF